MKRRYGISRRVAEIVRVVRAICAAIIVIAFEVAMTVYALDHIIMFLRKVLWS
jgi:hypothetical protein